MEFLSAEEVILGNVKNELMYVTQHTDEIQEFCLQTDNGENVCLNGIDKSNIPIQWPFSELQIPSVLLLRSPAAGGSEDNKHTGLVYSQFDKPQ